MRRVLVLTSWLIGCGGAVQHPPSAPDLSPASLYPLGEGHAWSYDVDSGDGASVLVVARVTSVQGDVVEVRNGAQAPLRYRKTSEGVAHADRPGHLLKAPIAVGASWSSGPHTEARVVSLKETVSTPSGPLHDCVLVAELNRDNEQRIETTYCPGVGPARVVAEMDVRGQLMRVAATLRGYTLAP
jgi:hypothetical protein